MKFKYLLKTYYPTLLITVVLTLFSIYAYYQTYKVIKDRRSKLFDLRVQQVRESISNRINDYIEILRGCQGIFYMSDTVTAAEWRTYTKALALTPDYKGIQGIAYAAWIPRKQIPEMETRIRKSGHPDFKIKTSGDNEFLTPIIYIEPFTGRNLRAYGFDMFSETHRRTAMKRAALTGQPSITKKVILIQETNKNIQPGFLLYLPIYNTPDLVFPPEKRIERLQGFVYNAFRAHDLMENILKNFSDITVEIYDGIGIKKQNILYDSADFSKADSIETPEFHKNEIIKIGGTQWTLNISSETSFGSSVERRQPALILVIGISITILLAITSILLIKRKTEVLKELSLSKELEKKKDEFIGIASHELKTPLTSIRAYMQLLERSNLDTKDKLFVNKTNLQIQKLNKLISDLLDVSKIQAGKLQLNISTFLLEDLIQDSVENVQHLYNSHQIIKPEHPPLITISADRLRLEQALTNLLINAVKYSPNSDMVHINTSIEEDKLKIEVQDTGIGISEEDQKQIFDKFYRSKELSPVLSGLGMGLYIAHEIVKRHHGRITVQSQPGKGTTFCICLPLAA